jgi:hypothetical protein
LPGVCGACSGWRACAKPETVYLITSPHPPPFSSLTQHARRNKCLDTHLRSSVRHGLIGLWECQRRIHNGATNAARAAIHTSSRQEASCTRYGVPSDLHKCAPPLEATICFTLPSLFEYTPSPSGAVGAYLLCLLPSRPSMHHNTHTAFNGIWRGVCPETVSSNQSKQ